MRILIVDDEKDQLKALDMGLRSSGFKTETACSAEKAMAVLERRNHSVDLVVTDFVMPGVNGLQLLRKIKKKYPFLPVVIMSAKGTDILAENTAERGGEKFMHKPFLMEELIREIRKITGQKVE